MRNRHIVIFVLLFFTGVLEVAKAQSIKTLEATRQNWSGGIAGRYGTNYTFKIEFSDFVGKTVLDTIWVDNLPFAIFVFDSSSTYWNTKCTKKKKSIFYEISIGTSHDEHLEMDRQIRDGQNKKYILPKPPVKINGVAMVRYFVNGKAKYYQINRFLKELDPINYP